MATIEQAVHAYVRLRDKVKEIKARQSEELAPYNEKMRTLENWMHSKLHDAEVKSMRTDAGTVFVQTNTKVKVTDWADALEFVRAGEHWDFLEARVSKNAVEDYIESTGDVPPGVHIDSEEVVRIRRS